MQQQKSWSLSHTQFKLSVWSSLLVLGLVTFGGTLQAQQDRVTGRIDNSRTIPLRGGVHRAAQPLSDQGPVEPSFKMGYISLLLKPSGEQQLMLNRLLAEQQDPFSPNYHRWITPEQYADRFAVSQADINNITSWVQSRGFTIDYTARSRTFVAFSGTAEQVGNAFQTEIHRYNVDSEIHFANSSEPSIPAALAAVVAGIRGLNDFYPKPPVKKGRPVARMTLPGSPHPNFSTTLGGHYLAPDDVATIYGIRGLFDAGVDGTGQRIVIVGTAKIGEPNAVSSTDDVPDLKQYRSKFNLAAANLRLVSVNGTSSNVAKDVIEAYLDLELVGSVARGGTLIYVYAANVATAVLYAVDQNLAPVISESFGGCEPDSATALFEQSVAQQANTQGMTWIASSGDSGANCYTIKSYINGVGFPASIPEVTAVGGTEFKEGDGKYWGSDGFATSYIPETAWNDGPAKAGGGGVSTIFPKPSWQRGSGYVQTPSDGKRDVPDVAFSASGDHDAYWICIKGSCGGFSDFFYNLVGIGAGGTSASAPVFAGIISLVNQYMGSTGLGNINPVLYQLASNTTNIFHDIQSGDNKVPCSDCLNETFGYSAVKGYDQVTGLGSVDAFKLAESWTGVPLRPNTTTALQVSPATVAQGGGVKLTATVTAVSTSKSPTGTVSFFNLDFSGSGPCEEGPVTLTPAGAGATAAVTLDTAQWSAAKCGTIGTVYASYSGDETFNGSISQLVHIEVSAAKTATTTTLTTSASQIAAGGTLTLRARVAPTTGSGTPTGTVTFYDGTAQLASQVKLDSSGVAPYTTNSMLPGKHSLAALFTPDSNSNYSGSLSAPVSVTSTAPTIAVNSQRLSKAVDTRNCSAPSPNTTFVTSDPAVWLWFNVSGAKSGDVASAIWFGPDGSVYVSGTWDPLASGGDYCLWWNLDVAGNPPATSPGKWSVRVLWNGSSVFKLDFTIQPAVTLTGNMVAKSVDTTSCKVPSPATAFLTTDQTAFVWFSVDGANAGDVASVTWYTPTGPVHKSAKWNPLESAGNWCFNSSIDIVKNTPASSPGNWAVRASWNGSALFTRNFTILAPNSSPQPQITSLKPSSVVAGSGSTELSILGNNFLPASVVTFNGQVRPITTSPDARHLTIALTASDLANVGTYAVALTNPVSGSATAASNKFNFPVLDPKTPQPAVTSIWMAQTLYSAGDWFTANYSSWAGTASGTFDLMIKIVPKASGNTYYYYDDPSDSNEWLHTTPRPLRTGTPQTGPFTTPSSQMTDSVPSGDYHVWAYYSKPGANQPVGAIAETDFSIATNTAAGGCFIATAAFGSPIAYQVQNLRIFRDRTILSSQAGTAFVNWYYEWSPRAAEWLRGHSVARKLTRAVLWVPIAFAWSSLRTNVLTASMGFVVLFLLLGWSLQRGPVWWRGLCLSILVVAVASAR